MSAVLFDNTGDDPLLSADVLTGAIDPTLVDQSLPLTSPSGDISLDTLALNPDSNSFPVYGPSLAQLGANPNSPSIIGSSDPSAFNASATTAPTKTPSVLDDILGVSKLGLSIFSATQSRGGALANPTTGAQKVGTAKSPTSGAGTSMTLVFFAIAFFVGLFLWAEIKH
jgi:hypothetical protein